MVDIAEQWQFIFSLLIFYGFLYICFYYGSEYIYGVTFDTSAYASENYDTAFGWSGDSLSAFGTFQNFYEVMFNLPLQSDNILIFVLNLAITGTLVFMLIKMLLPFISSAIGGLIGGLT